MGKHDSNIAWLRDRIADAVESLADIEKGRRTYINDEDVTPWWKAKYEQIIISSSALIRGYQKRDG